jgi:hypothetical protein
MVLDLDTGVLPHKSLKLVHSDFLVGNGETMIDPFSMLGLPFSHLEFNRPWNDDHRLTLTVDVPSTDVPFGGRPTLVRFERWESEFSEFLVAPLYLIDIPQLAQQPF